jgi:hypothetical protein
LGTASSASKKWYLTKAGRREFNQRADDEWQRTGNFADAWTWYDDDPRDPTERDAFRNLFWSCENASDVIRMIVEENTALLERGISVPRIDADAWHGLKVTAITDPLLVASMERAWQKQRKAEVEAIIDEAERYVSDVTEGRIKPLDVGDLMPV